MFIYVIILIVILNIFLAGKKVENCYQITNNTITYTPADNIIPSNTCVRLSGTLLNNALIVGGGNGSLWTSSTPNITRGNAYNNDGNDFLVYLNENIITGTGAEVHIDITFLFPNPITTFRYYTD